MVVGRFVEMCRRRRLKVSAGKVKVMVMNGEEGLECEAGIHGRRVAGAIRSIVNAMDLQLECSRVLYETLIVPILTYGSETKL